MHVLKQAGGIAEKEMVDAMRDPRSLISVVFYVLIGPLVMGMVGMATHKSAKPETNGGMLTAMLAMFALVSTFVGGMNLSMDTIAGERERHSLLPLLLNAVPRTTILLGKWLAVAVFSIAGLAINLAGASAVMVLAGIHTDLSSSGGWIKLALGLVPLALLAASAELLISAVCRTVKEAHTYLSLLIFIPMVAGMFVVFFPAAGQEWCRLLPLTGQELQLQALLHGGGVPLFEPVVLGCLTAMVGMGILLWAGNRLQRDEIVYGN